VKRIGNAVLALILALPAYAAELDAPTRPALEALALCEAADDLPPQERRLLLARGLEIAEAAVAADGSDAKAHFAVFCTLGKQVREAGVSLGALADLRRLRREIDVALDLDPGDSAALAAKGAMLLELPRWLGGDPRDGEALLHAALRLDPRNRAARDYLERHAASDARAGTRND
jgi:hypothetical protein